MAQLEAYHINLESFQGPLDLLLFLIRKKKIDIQDIPLSSITQDYLKYLDRIERINLEREAEFILMAALLIHIKSQTLLPRETIDEEGGALRPSYTGKLLDYQKMKAASNLLRDREEVQMKQWQRLAPLPDIEAEETELTEVSLFTLAEAFFELMKRKEKENVTVIRGKEVSIEEKMEEMIAHLRQNRHLDFFEYFSRQGSIEEALVSFFCLLELIKARIVIAVQERLFQTIKVWLREEYDA